MGKIRVMMESGRNMVERVIGEMRKGKGEEGWGVIRFRNKIWMFREE